MAPVLSEFARNAMHFAALLPWRPWLNPQVWGRPMSALEPWIGCWPLEPHGLAWHVVTQETAIYERGVRLEPFDWVAIGWLVFCAIEFSRRVAGWIVPVLIVLALSYIALWGSMIPGVFRFAGLSIETLAFQVCMATMACLAPLLGSPPPMYLSLSCLARFWSAVERVNLSSI